MKNRITHIFRKYSNLSVVLKASVWFAAVSFIDKAISLLTQPFVNRILTTEQVGVYGIYTSWYSIFSIIATFNLFCGVLEVYLTKNKKDKNNIAGSLSILCLIVSVSFFGILFIFVKPISSFLGLKPIYLLMMALTIVGESLIQFWAVPKRFEYSYKSYAILIVGLFTIKSVLSVLLTYGLTSDRVLGRLLGLSIPTFIVGVILFILIISRTSVKNITKYWKKALKFNIPLIPHYLAVVILSSSDRVMIGHLCGETETGLYSIAYLYASLSLIVFNAINLAYNPRAMQYIKDCKYNELEKTTEIVLVFSIIFSLILAYLAPEGLFIIGGSQYLETLSMIPVLTVGIFFSSFYFIFSNIEFIYEKTKIILLITIFGASLNVGLNYVLIPVLGYEVAAYTTLLGYLVIAVLHYIVSKRIIKRDVFNIKMIVFYLVTYIAMSFMAIQTYNKSPIVRYVFVLAFLILLVIYFANQKNVIVGNQNKEK